MSSGKKYATDRAPRVLPKGNFKGGQPRYPSLAAALWSRVKIGGEDECWPWTASIGSHGYGQFSWESKVITWHTTAFMVTNGPIAAGVHILHRCDNRRCCNPRHLYAGDQTQNNVDARERGRAYKFGKAEFHPKAKLSAQDVAAIRRARTQIGYGKKLHIVLAKQYNVHPDTIQSIWSGRTWRTG